MAPIDDLAGADHALLRKKINLGRINKKIRINLQPHPDLEGKSEEARKLINAMVNEESTDIITEWISSLLPFGIGWAASKVLDRMLPGAFRALLYKLADRVTGAV